MNIEEIKQAVINNVMQTKATEISELESCLKFHPDIKVKASCANKLGLIYFLTDEDTKSKLEAVRYFHIAYELEPGNETYRDNACMHTFASIVKYSTQAFSSDVEADGVLHSFNIMNKCENYVFPWAEGTIVNDHMFARAANNLGMFYYTTEQTKDNLEKAKKFFKIAYDLETYQKVTYGGSLAAVHYKLGEISEAVFLYDECLKAEITIDFPKTEKANCAGTLSLIALETKAFEQALALSKLANQLDPDNGYYIHNLASSYLATKQYAKAKYYLKKCLDSELTDHFTEATRENCYKGLEILGHLNDEL